MQSCFLANITTAERDVLKAELIDTVNFELNNLYGVLIDNSFVPRALEVLGLVALRYDKTEYLGISWCQTTKKPVGAVDESPVAVGQWDGAGKRDEYARLIEQILVPVVGRVILSVPHSRRETIDDGPFRVKIWSTSLENHMPQVIPPRKMWGIKVDCQDKAFLASGVGLSIVDSETSTYSVAELVKNNLFIHHDVCHFGTQDELAIFKKILEEAALEFSGTPEEREERRKRRLEGRKAKSVIAYATACSRLFEKTIIAASKKIMKMECDIVEKQRELVGLIRELEHERTVLSAIQAARPNEEEKFKKEFERLLSFPKVRDVLVDNDTLLVYTDVLFCTHPETMVRYEIGAFKIVIYMDNGAIRWFNLTRQVDGHKKRMQAPHVYYEGNACLGTMNEMIPDLFGHREFVQLVMICIQFIETVNTKDDAGKHIVNWPMAKESVAVATTKEVSE